MHWVYCDICVYWLLFLEGQNKLKNEEKEEGEKKRKRVYCDIYV